jgi:hypothetical protein
MTSISTSNRIRKNRDSQKIAGESNVKFFGGKLAAPSGIDDPGYNDRLCARPPCKAKASQGLWPRMPLDQDHVGFRCAVAHFARLAVFLAIEPFPGAVS